MQQLLDQLQAFDISLWSFLGRMVLAAILSGMLSAIYVYLGRSLSDRRAFARIFIPITLTTTIIMTILQTNIALSLGLIGALSIVRFRTAIKEPEELSYLFLCIALGLGMGAAQKQDSQVLNAVTVLTLAGFVCVSMVLVIWGLTGRRHERQNMFLTVAGPAEVELDQIVQVLKTHCTSVDLKRLDEPAGTSEAMFLITLKDYAALNQTRQALRQLNESLSMTFVENTGQMS